MVSRDPDLDKNGIPDVIQRPVQGVTSPISSGAEAQAAAIRDELAALGIIIPEGDKDKRQVFVGGDVGVLDADKAKDWYAAQWVQKTPAWQQIKSAMAGLGYEKDRDILSILNAGVDYAASNEYATVLPQYGGAANPFEFIMAQPPREGSGGGGGGPYRQEQTNISLSSPSRGAAIYDQAARGEIGRMATEEEGQQFTQALNMMERQNPSKSVRTGVSSPGSNTDVSTTTTSGGFDPSLFARDWARSQSDYAENYAAGTFLKILDEVLQRPDVMAQRMGAGA